MKKIIIIKLGGSIITDKTTPYSPDLDAIKSLVKEIEAIKKPLLIVHGQGSFAHTSAKQYGGKKGYKNKFGISKVFNDAMDMNSIVIHSLVEKEIPAVSFRPNSLFFAKSGRLFKSNLEPVLEAINQGLIPVMYGDVVMDKDWKTTIFSGEKVITHLIPFLIINNIEVDKIVQVGITDGVYDANGKTIPFIDRNNYKKIKNEIFGASTTDVTGGMKHKIDEAIEVSKKKIKTYIINGKRKNELLKAVNEDVVTGTIIK